MLEFSLTYFDEEEFVEISLEKDTTSFGRAEVDFRFEDEGLSRLHATIYRDGDRVWVVDENSTNGTFVNGEEVSPAGTPLADGDVIRIGHNTDLTVKISERLETLEEDVRERNDSFSVDSSVAVESEQVLPLIPLLITGLALFVIGSAAVFIAYNVLSDDRQQVVRNNDDDSSYEPYDSDSDDESEDEEENTETNSNNTNSPPNSSPTAETAPRNQNETNDSEITESPTASKQQGDIAPSGKRYQEMSLTEKNQYIKVKSERVARIIGNRSGESIPPEALAKIKRFLDGYVGRIRSVRRDDCGGKTYTKSDIASLLERARKNSPFIIRAFNKRGIDPQIGLYVAMIESEHCPCLQSGTGPLGMFQFTRATGARHGLKTRRGASPSNPDERCEKEPAAHAAASYMKSLTGRIGTGPLSIPLAIASYNSGEGGLGKNLRIALEANQSQERSFWTLVANAEKLAKQFQSENIKYVPKFFAAAIIGENPRDFGISMQPLSTYTS